MKRACIRLPWAEGPAGAVRLARLLQVTAEKIRKTCRLYVLRRARGGTTTVGHAARLHTPDGTLVSGWGIPTARIPAVITGLDTSSSSSTTSKRPSRLRDAAGRAPSWRYSGDGAARCAVHARKYDARIDGARWRRRSGGRIRAVLAEQGEGMASLCFRTATSRKCTAGSTG
jgi:hypothetical protein